MLNCFYVEILTLLIKCFWHSLYLSAAAYCDANCAICKFDSFYFQTVCLRELLSASLDLAEAGGTKVVEVKKAHKLNAESKGKTKEGANEMKTDGDMQSHRAIVAGFHKTFPALAPRVSKFIICTILLKYWHVRIHLMRDTQCVILIC